MPEDISLLPKEVEKKRAQEVRGKLLQKASLVFLAVSVLFGVGLFIYSLSLRFQLSNLEKSIAVEKSEIGSLSGVEATAHDLDARVNVLKDVFADKIYFSKLLSALSGAVPADVSVTEITVPSAEAVSVSGTSRSYVSLAKFLTELKEDGLFEVVKLLSVSLDEQTGGANFGLNLTIAKGGLGQ